MKLKFYSLILPLCLLFTFPVVASEMGPAINTKIPHDLNVPNQDGNIQAFEELAGDKGLVLFFVRSADWCPYCKIQILDLNNRYNEFTDLGYNVAVLSYDEVEKLKQFVDQYKIAFPLLSDTESEIIQAFDILNTEKVEGEFGYGIPYPGVFVIAPDKTLTSKYFEEGYKERPDLDVILKDLQK